MADRNDHLSKISRDLRKRIHRDPSQHFTSKGSMKFQDYMQKVSTSDPLELPVSSSSTYGSQGSYMLPLLPSLNMPVNSSNVSIVLGGTACRGGNGPSVGAVDIGIGKLAYYFRIALPGVKKDPGEFSCEIERDGKVHVRGVTTTGEQYVCRCSRIYEMKFQQQCLPGPFTVSFCLPGPVDPRLFSPNFRSDGIFEGVVFKYAYHI